uniref:Similar to PDR8/PEN3 (PLEIOTROPIC DRUG RESISTANCE8) n=1 Tax=Arundo donax TaxID=35708 RepID=A0A0A9G1M9_ARUDO
MNPPSTNMKMTTRDPAVLVTTIVLHMPETNLKSPEAICWIKKTAIRCLKNLLASGAKPMV